MVQRETVKTKPVLPLIAKAKVPTGNRWWFNSSLTVNGRYQGIQGRNEIWWRGAEHRWHWWREPTFCFNPDYWKLIWRDGAERAAFEYELARRSTARALKLPTFPELTPNEREFITSLFGVADARWVAFSDDKAHSAQCPFFWNLKETPRAMWKVFKGWLEYERAKRGLPSPKSRPQNKRPTVWKWFDLLDAGVESGDDTGRSLKSKAMKRGGKAFAALESALADSENENLKRLARVFRASVR